MLTIVGDNDFEVKQLQGATEHYVSRLGEKIELGIYHYIAFTVLNPESDVSANLECQTINPELMPGVVALAINPNDERYVKYIGKYAVNPVTDVEIPIITDKRIDHLRGTGVLALHPSHSNEHFDIVFNADRGLSTNTGCF